MLSNLDKYHIILASNSPRRKSLLAGLDVPFEVRTLPDIDESYPDTLQGGDIPLYISRKKAQSYQALMQPTDLIITADTIVWLGGEVLGKPRDKAQAKEMLRKLSGHTHEVFTGVTLGTTAWQRSFVVGTKVQFGELSDQEIEYYVERYAPLDKAGAYGVQEWIGYIGVERLEGSFYNVMGLPVQRLYQELRKV